MFIVMFRYSSYSADLVLDECAPKGFNASKKINLDHVFFETYEEAKAHARASVEDESDGYQNLVFELKEIIEKRKGWNDPLPIPITYVD